MTRKRVHLSTVGAWHLAHLFQFGGAAETFLPACSGITKLGIKQIMADHGLETLVDNAFFAALHLINRRFHVVVDAAFGNATEC